MPLHTPLQGTQRRDACRPVALRSPTAGRYRSVALWIHGMTGDRTAAGDAVVHVHRRWAGVALIEIDQMSAIEIDVLLRGGNPVGIMADRAGDRTGAHMALVQGGEFGVRGGERIEQEGLAVAPEAERVAGRRRGHVSPVAVAEDELLGRAVGVVAIAAVDAQHVDLEFRAQAAPGAAAILDDRMERGVGDGEAQTLVEIFIKPDRAHAQRGKIAG